jgi:AraC family transcriptional regulator of adaptative response / DNA-3-methyladenine glycosylase II
MAVRAIVGQQVSVAGARTTLTRMIRAAAAGDGPSFAASATPHLIGFPAAAVVAELPDSAFGMPVARRQTIRALAEAVAAGKIDLDPGADRDESVARLVEVPGIGAWTAGYVAMRAIGDPDVFLPTDLAVRRGAAALGLPATPKALAAHAERWRPWRSYALVRLWKAS